MSMYGTMHAAAMEMRAKAAQRYVQATWKHHWQRRRPHGLRGDLTVSLTSYAKRFPTLAPTLQSLLAQSIAPTRLVLWVAQSDRDAVPRDVLDLQSFGLTIRTCEDLRSYKKLIPALHAFPADVIVVADDDVYYRRHWLAELVAEHRDDLRQVICARAHVVTLDAQGAPRPYHTWTMNTRATGPSDLLFPTGCGGVLYAPGVLHTDVTKAELFMQLCQSTDDVWFYWMALRNRASFRRVPTHHSLVTWIGSQGDALYHSNNTPDGGNDTQMRNLIERFGWPVVPA